jgi:catechol 2,3-dioxygenase-like lactoylglutathione lyase family enzyme
MFDPNFVLLYVDDPRKSAAFYEGLFGSKPVEDSPTFVMFVLKPGLNLGLWSRHTVAPAATAAGGGGELAFTAESKHAVSACYETWKKKGISFLQDPVDLDFGFTFVALDPDGHRLRVYVPCTEL